MTKKGWQLAAAVLAITLVGGIGLGSGGGSRLWKAEPAAAAGVAADPAALNTITVGASGSVTVDPDIAYVNATVETRGSTASEAQKANADKFAAVEKVLYEKFGLSKKDVQTSGFYVQAEYNYSEKDGRKLIGYVAAHSIQVKYRQLSDIGKLLDALTAAGANRMDGVRFQTEKSDQYELEALKKAMANADAKAGVLASAAKRQLKGVVNIVQGASSAPPVVYMDQAKMMATADASTSIQTGQIEITANVTVQYEMQ